MLLDGKKEDRFMLRVTPEMGRQVRARAELNHRPYEEELRVRIALGLGLSQNNVHEGQAILSNLCQPVATEVVPVTFADEKAKQLMATPVKSRQQNQARRTA